MKKTLIKIEYDSEKYVALKHYLNIKNLKIEDEIEKVTEKTIEKVYEKNVPIEVRKFIKMKGGGNKKEGKIFKDEFKNSNKNSKNI